MNMHPSPLTLALLFATALFLAGCATGSGGAGAQGGEHGGAAGAWWTIPTR